MVNDCSTFKVSNKLIFAGSMLGLALRIYEQGFLGIFSFAVGYLVPFLVLFLLFLFHMLGTGDIKVFCMIGGFYGIQVGILSIFYAFLISSLFSIILILRYPKLMIRFQYFIRYVYDCFMIKKILPYIASDVDSRAVIHFTISILLAFGMLVWQQPQLFV